MLHKCVGSMSYKDQYWEHLACNVSKKESKEKVADMLMPEIIGYKVKEQVRAFDLMTQMYPLTVTPSYNGTVLSHRVTMTPS